MDNTDTNVDSVALEKHLMVDAPKNLKLKKEKKNLNYELNAFGGKKLREYCNKLRTEFSLLIVSC